MVAMVDIIGLAHGRKIVGVIIRPDAISVVDNCVSRNRALEVAKDQSMRGGSNSNSVNHQPNAKIAVIAWIFGSPWFTGNEFSFLHPGDAPNRAIVVDAK